MTYDNVFFSLPLSLSVRGDIDLRLSPKAVFFIQQRPGLEVEWHLPLASHL